MGGRGEEEEERAGVRKNGECEDVGNPHCGLRQHQAVSGRPRPESWHTSPGLA